MLISRSRSSPSPGGAFRSLTRSLTTARYGALLPQTGRGPGRRRERGAGARLQAALGYVSFTFTPGSAVCGPQGAPTTYWAVAASFVYHDALGAGHAFNGAAIYNSNAFGQGTANCGPNDSQSLSGLATDGSGYQLSISINGYSLPQNVVLQSLRAKSGTSIAAPLVTGSDAGGSVTDTNGNQISVAYNGSTTFTDTLGTSALTVTGSGTPASPLMYNYTIPGGSQLHYTVNYANYTVKTNFACGGTGEYGGAGGTVAALVSSVVLPDGTQYSFSYEPTQGTSGYVTGRLSQVTLPTGGTIKWQYYTGPTPANTIVCADGSGMNMQRISDDGTTSFSRVESPSWQTIMTDGMGRDTVMNFQSLTVSNTIYSYETQRQTYLGSHTSGTPLQTVNTGYNGSQTASPCVAGTLSLPISQVEVSTTWPYNNNANNVQSQVCSNYDTTNAGRLAQVTEYSYGNGTLGTAIRRQTSYSYASLGNGIYTAPAEIKVTNGSTTYSDTQYQYDQGTVMPTSGTPQHVGISGSRGNPTTIKQLTSGTTYLTTTQTFFDTGNVQTVTDPNTSPTTQVYGAASCGNSFPTSTTLLLSLSRSYTWDCNGAVQLTLTDESGNPWTTAYADPHFWRPTSTTDPTNAITGITYPSSQTTAESALTFNGSTSIADTRVTLDGYGRTLVSQVKQGPAANSPYDSVQIYYDATGRPKTSTIPMSARPARPGLPLRGRR